MEIEETVGSKDESQVNLSSGSTTEYFCRQLYMEKGKAGYPSKDACITVLETKHIRDKHYAQILGYYCYNKEAVDHKGIAIQLNEYDGHVTVGFFIFQLVQKRL